MNRNRKKKSTPKPLSEKALHYYELEVENKELKNRVDEQFHFSNIIGRSKKMRDVLEVLTLAAPSARKSLKVDVRVIAATHRNLEAAIKDGTFREDLYFRLSVVTVDLPPLRERREDVPSLAEHFLKKYAEKNQRLVKGFSSKTLDIFMRYEWPGNIRELENTIERAVILCREEYVQPQRLPGQFQGLLGEDSAAETGVRPGHSIREVEKELILKTLEQTGGNRTRAAEILGITRRALQYKLKEYGM